MGAVLSNFHRYQWELWQAYEHDGCITLTTKDRVHQLTRDGLLSPDATLRYEFRAETPESASMIHHHRQGWEPYNPMGDSELCPGGCGNYYYPAGSGTCPVCGSIS